MQQSARRRSYRTFKKGTVSTIAASDWLRFHTENRFKKEKKNNKKTLNCGLKGSLTLMQFILFTNRLRWIAPFTIFIENFIVLKSLIGNRVKKSALKDADQKNKSSMRDFYCNYAHFWFLFWGDWTVLFVF